jgi:2-amino-4-hydroxy-6-hydroxymethyldihydropteridine diphosphokinase
VDQLLTGHQYSKQAAWGKTNQENFLNQALVLETTLNPRDLLNEILYIENLMGRDRVEKYGPRIIDIDIIFFNHQKNKRKRIGDPSPGNVQAQVCTRTAKRSDSCVYSSGIFKTVKELLQQCDDTLPVKKII